MREEQARVTGFPQSVYVCECYSPAFIHSLLRSFIHCLVAHKFVNKALTGILVKRKSIEWTRPLLGESGRVSEICAIKENTHNFWVAFLASSLNYNFGLLYMPCWPPNKGATGWRRRQSAAQAQTAKEREVPAPKTKTKRNMCQLLLLLAFPLSFLYKFARPHPLPIGRPFSRSGAFISGLLTGHSGSEDKITHPPWWLVVENWILIIRSVGCSGGLNILYLF